jgi:hypothetical protein
MFIGTGRRRLESRPTVDDTTTYRQRRSATEGVGTVAGFAATPTAA